MILSCRPGPRVNHDTFKPRPHPSLGLPLKQVPCPNPHLHHLLNGPDRTQRRSGSRRKTRIDTSSFVLLLALVTGGTVQCRLTVKFGVLVLVVSCFVQALTSTGVIAPVLSLNSLCLNTRSNDTIPLLWDIVLTYVLLSWAMKPSRIVLERTSCVVDGSPVISVQ